MAHGMVIDGNTQQIIAHIQDERLILKHQNNSVASREQGDSIILPMASVTTAKQLGYHFS